MVRGVALALVLLTYASMAPGQGQEVHGENSVFAGHGVAIAWGVLKGPMEEQTQVILRIVPAGEAYAYVSVEAVDPFTGKRQPVLAGHPLGDRLDVRSPRGTYADFPRREVHLYRTTGDWQAQKPAVTVYYLGVPDTTPEFISEGALFTYIDQALAKVRGASRGRTP
ncbi:MAG: hypothetical protein HY803_16630 [candidate division NC10 bacterium]|nr:hypothetical protein [candidate division NC10 bacterium]